MRKLSLIITVALLCCFGSAWALQPWGVVTLPVAHLRNQASHASEMVSQAVMGTPVKVTDKKGDFLKVQLPDGYIGWMSVWSVATMDSVTHDIWKRSKRVMVVGEKHCTSTPLLDLRTMQPISDLDRLSIVCVDDKHFVLQDDKYIAVSTPDGRTGLVLRHLTRPLDKLTVAATGNVDKDELISDALDMMGEVYLWGGTSFNMVDCSGLTSVCFAKQGMIVPRDTGDLYKVGTAVALEDRQPGDIIFYGTPASKVNHVAIYIGDNKIIHSSGQVQVNSINPDNGNCGTRRMIGIKRISNSLQPGIKTLATHPWY